MIFISHTRITPTQVLNPIGAPTGAPIGFSQQLHVSASFDVTWRKMEVHTNDHWIPTEPRGGPGGRGGGNLGLFWLVWGPLALLGSPAGGTWWELQRARKLGLGLNQVDKKTVNGYLYLSKVLATSLAQAQPRRHRLISLAQQHPLEFPLGIVPQRHRVVALGQQHDPPKFPV